MQRLLLTMSFLIACCVVAMEPPATPQYPELLPNPSFEQDRDQDDWPDAWGHKRPAGKLDMDMPHHGRQSLKLTGPGQQLYMEREQALIPETTYRFSIWVRTSALESQGIRLRYLQKAPSQLILAQSDVSGECRTWTELAVDVTAPPDHESGVLHVIWHLGKGETAWLDSASFQPVNSEIPALSAPQIIPAGGTYRGRLRLLITHPRSDVRIRLTLDGREPTPDDWLYTHPFMISASCTVKAKAFHDAYRPSGTEAMAFDMQPILGRGVPVWPVDWSAAVTDWWARHPYNPVSPGHVATLESPDPQIDVAEIHQQHPESTTAGIAEALAILPERGGTLWFPKSHGAYNVTAEPSEIRNLYTTMAAIPILDRSRLHFRSDGATIRCPTTLFGIVSLAYQRDKTMQQPVTNFYFKGLTFHGDGRATNAVTIRHGADILFDDCTFTGYAVLPGQQTNIVLVSCLSENVWLRRCHFTGGEVAVAMQSTVGGGVVDCTFRSFRQSGVRQVIEKQLVDLSPRMPQARYQVIANCSFDGKNQPTALAGIIWGGSHCLAIDNQVANLPTFVLTGGEGGLPPPIRPFRYHHQYVAANTLQEVDTLIEVVGMKMQAFNSYSIGDIVVEGNRAEGLNVLARIHPRQTGAAIDNVLITGNEVRGEHLPQVVLLRDGARDIVVRENILRGDYRDMVRFGKTVENERAILLENNQLLP